MPRKFFEQHVKPDYEDWLRAPLDERHAKNAVSNANNMAARVWHYWTDQGDLSKVFGEPNEGAYRNALAVHECSDFGLVRDVADAFKHFQLDRPSRRLTRTNQTAAGGMGFGEGKFGEGVFGGGPQLVVTLDDGTKRPLTSMMRNVMDMWERLLSSWSL
ncbi:MAG: hypothetical protein KDJ88_20735 [Bauldia sp.]|nr:hypothetical protein [Bauldia sp.]